MTAKLDPKHIAKIDPADAEENGPETELLCVSDPQLIKLFETGEGFIAIREQLDEVVQAIDADAETPAGRKALKSVAYKLAQLRTRCDKVGLEHVRDRKEAIKIIDKNRAQLRDLLQTRQNEVREPVTRWEIEEAARIEAIKSEINRIAELGSATRLDNTRKTLEELKQDQETLQRIGGATASAFAEFEADASNALLSALANVQQAIEWRTEEAERLRKAAEEARIAREAAEKAEAQARKDREEARVAAAAAQAAAIAREKALNEAREKQERERKAEDERVEKRVAEELQFPTFTRYAQTLKETREEQEKMEREALKRQIDERARDAAREEARREIEESQREARAETDMERREEILQGIADSLCDLMGEAQYNNLNPADASRFVVDAIANGEVDNLSIDLAS